VGYKLVEQDTITSDCVDGLPPPGEGPGHMVHLNIFYWPGPNKVCFVTRNITTGYLELWTRTPGSPAWTKVSDSGAEWNTTYEVLACYDPTDGGVVLAYRVNDIDSDWRWGKIAYSAPNYTWSARYPGTTTDWQLQPGLDLVLCRGTTTNPRPLVIGWIRTPPAAFAWQSASFDPTVADGLDYQCAASALPWTGTDAIYGRAALDESRDVIVWVTNQDGTPENQGVWEGSGLSGDGFTKVSDGANGFSHRFGHSVCYHPGLQGVIAYGGFDAMGTGEPMGRGAHLWNGTLWVPKLGTEVTYSDPLGGEANNHFFRFFSSMVYDPVREVLVLFRGTQKP